MARRSPPVQWRQQIETIKNSYENRLSRIKGIDSKSAYAHAVQKDAIQNSIDAYDKNNPDEWTLTIELDKWPNPTYVSFTDTGTYGLTGRKNLTSTDLDALSFHQYKEERWSRFEALGYKNMDPRAVGARGQGKFVLIAASKKKRILYETIRKDGVHRVGDWDGEDAQPCIDPLEGEIASAYVQKMVPQIDELSRVGTRVIILDPVDELVHSFFPLMECSFADYVQETWWEKILDGYIIKLKVKGLGERKIEAPILFQKIRNGDYDPSNVVYLENIPIKSKVVKKARIEELVIGHTKNKLSALYHGICIQRAGMKVKLHDTSRGNDFIPKEYTKEIFGWIKLNHAAERVIRENDEDPDHYDITIKQNSFSAELFGSSGVLAGYIAEFAEEKLGLIPEDKRTLQKEKLHTKSLSALNKFARKLGYIFGTTTGGGGGGGGGGRSKKELFIDMPFPEFPNGKDFKRINFGQTLQNIEAKIVNRLDDEALLDFEIHLIKKVGQKTGGEEVQDVLITEQITVNPKSESKTWGPYDIRFDKTQYLPGIYVLEARIVSVNDQTLVDSVRYLIYLERNPPSVGIFEDIQYVELKPPANKYQYRVKKNEGKLILQVNILHPLYVRSQKLDEAIAKQRSPLDSPLYFDYVVQLGMSALMREDLTGDGKLVKDYETIERVRAESYETFEDTLNSSFTMFQELLSDVFEEE